MSNIPRSNGRPAPSIGPRGFLAVTGAVALGGCPVPRSSGGRVMIEASVGDPLALSVPAVESPIGSIRDRIARLRVRLYRTHPPTERRLAALEALEREQR